MAERRGKANVASNAENTANTQANKVPGQRAGAVPAWMSSSIDSTAACTPRPGRLLLSGVASRSPWPSDDDPMMASRPRKLLVS